MTNATKKEGRKRRSKDPKKEPREIKYSKGRSRWNDFHYITIYLLATDGFTDRAIADAIGVSTNTFTFWKKNRPVVKLALERARKKTGDSTATGLTLTEFIYQRLPEELKPLYDEISALDNEPNGVIRMETLLQDAGKRARQHLFLHALIGSGYNVSEACRRVNISRHTLNGWKTNEPQFHELMDEMLEHQKSFCEGALMKLVDFLEPSAVMFANKTLNKEKYSEKLTVEHQGDIKHTHEHVIDFTTLNLKPDTLMELYNAVEEQERNNVIMAESKRITENTPAGVPA